MTKKRPLAWRLAIGAPRERSIVREGEPRVCIDNRPRSWLASLDLPRVDRPMTGIGPRIVIIGNAGANGC
ncbi:hypothetical protein N8198_08920 [Gammaproteobacteria bacterium]|nr:hypothetical protein [Gammaproteobacteria bacterium]